MTDLSPTAQAVVNAAVEVTGYGKETWLLKARVAAALEAVADEVVPPDPCGNDCCITQCEQIRHELLAIAAELRGTNPTETP